jgi:hypothetical protein
VTVADIVAQAPAPVRGDAQICVRCYGVDVDASFRLAGLSAGNGASGSKRAAVSLISRTELERCWPTHAVRRISEQTRPDGRRVSFIDEHPVTGFLMYEQGFGRFLVSPDGTVIRCAPLQIAAWRWQRYLVGQALPFAALLQGLEVFHASAVAIGGRALALVGAPLAGKSSLAAALVLGGSRFVADDVLAIERDGDSVLAHPGVGLLNLRHSAAEQLSGEERARLGRLVGRDESALRLAVEPYPGPLPLAAVVFLERRDGRGALALEMAKPLDPRLLLAGSFNFVVRTPDRLERQLDACSAVARSAKVYRALVPANVGAAELARELQALVAR